VNDLKQDDFETFVMNSFWYRFKSLVPVDVRIEKKRPFFTAPYTANLRNK
jgi:hypothetical protein